MVDPATPAGRWRLSIAARLAIGFGTVALVLLAGDWYASRSAKFAIDTLNDTAAERIPFALAAGRITDQLLTYDRAVFDQLRASDTATHDATAQAEQRLDAAARTTSRSGRLAPRRMTGCSAISSCTSASAMS